MDGNYVSRLEYVQFPDWYLQEKVIMIVLLRSQYVLDQQDQGVIELAEEDQGVIVAGGMARELLKDN